MTTSSPSQPASSSSKFTAGTVHSAAGMAGERTKLLVTERETLGSAETRRLRKRGLVPGVLYGSGEPVAICVESRELRRALTGAAGLHSILDVEIDGKGKTHASILKEYQVDPVRGGVTHIDLQEVRLDQTINASVSVNLIGGDVAPGVKEGGVLSQVLREVTVEALPLEVPEHIDIDVSTMEIGGTLRLAELTAPEGVTILGEMESVVATITAPTREEVVEPTEEELAAAEAAGEGEAGEGEGGEDAPADAEAEASGDEAPAEE
jgi:large subunit ribosomal protein L25